MRIVTIWDLRIILAYNELELGNWSIGKCVKSLEACVNNKFDMDLLEYYRVCVSENPYC